MALKLSMWPWVLQYYQGCSNDDLRLTLTFLRQGQILEKNLGQKIHENFRKFGIKSGIVSRLHEYMRFCEYKRSSSCFNF